MWRRRLRHNSRRLSSADRQTDLGRRGLRTWVCCRQTGVPDVRAARFAGRSTNSFLDNVRWAKRGIFSFSYQPLELISLLAFLVTFLAAGSIVIYLALYFIKPDAPRGFFTLVAMVLFLGAVQLFSLSIMAEYLGRIFEEVKQRPPYVVRNVLNDRRRAVPKSQDLAAHDPNLAAVTMEER